MSETVSILSNILNMDVFLDCPTKIKTMLLLYIMQDLKQTVFIQKYSGKWHTHQGTSSFSNFLTGLPSKTIKLLLGRTACISNIMPVLNELKEVIGVIIVSIERART